MGSCVSVDKYPTSAMKLCCSVGSTKTKEILIPSPKKDNVLKNNDALVSDVDVKAKTQTTFRSFGGSKEEHFFDSQPWLESDCEDDYYSVNGDFTPSRRNTPVHHSFSSFPQRKVTVPEKVPVLLPEPSPKKRLSELFKDSVREHQDSSDGQDGANNNNDKPATGNPYLSGANSGYSAEKNPNGRTPDETSVRSAQCCLPRMRSSRSYSKRKKKLSPVHTVG